jgi:hypothetical protein
MRVIRHLARSRVAAALAAGVLALLAIGSAARVGTSTFGGRASAATPNGTFMHHFTPVYMGGHANYTQAQAIALAQQFDVIAGGPFARYTSAMHLANPALKIVAYVNAAMDTTPNGTAYPASWYAHDGNGNRIRSVGFGNWLMDPTNPQWAPTVANLCSAALSRSHDDGCFLDTLGLGPIHPHYVTSLPVDPATHQVYTPAAWISANTNTVAAVEKVAKVTIPNGLADGVEYPQTSPLLATSHIAMAENWLRVSTAAATAFPTTAEWVADVNMLADAQVHGWDVMTVTKLWINASAAQVTQWHKFTVASFLMGAGGGNAYNFSPAKTNAGMTAVDSYDRAAVGTPIGSYALRNGVYQRSFTNGLSIVNPGSSPVTVTFGTPYTNLDGNTVAQETLGPNSGDVLVSGVPSLGMTWSFEDGTTDNWAGGNATLVPTTAQAYSGVYSLRMTVTANGSGYALSQHPFSGSSVVPSQSVSLSMYVKAGSASRYAQVILDWYTATGAFVSQSLGIAAKSSTSRWTLYAVTGTAPPNAAFYAAELFVGNGSLAGEVTYIDLVTATVG